jgi:hypothetical protein
MRYISCFTHPFKWCPSKWVVDGRLVEGHADQTAHDLGERREVHLLVGEAVTGRRLGAEEVPHDEVPLAPADVELVADKKC